jgi:molybdate transport system substrate-binding protein
MPLTPTVTLLGVALAAGSSGGATTSPAHRRALVVYAPATMAKLLPQAAPDAHYRFGDSRLLARRIAHGARPDVYVAIDPRYARPLYKRKLIELPRILVADQVVLVVPKANPAHIRALGDLARPRVRLLLPRRASPLDGYVQDELATLRARRRILRRVVGRARSVGATIRALSAGRANAGFVYTSDVAAARGRVDGVYPAIANPVYVVAKLRSTPLARRAARFLHRLLEQPAQRLFLRAGFVTTSDAGKPVRGLSWR